MKITEHITNKTNTILSLEVLPPTKGKNIEAVYDHLAPLMEFKPAWINVTYHRTESVYKTNGDGSFYKQEIRKRPGTVGICSALMNHYKVDAVPHIICGGFSSRETEDALLDLHYLGIDNILVLRGDAEKNEGSFIPHPKGHRFAIDLLKQAKNLNNGVYLDEEIEGGSATNFCTGVAGYPEKHFEAPNFDTDLRHLKAKVDAGAEYIITQMFFDNSKYFEFVKRCRAAGINIPIIPGLKPITGKKQLTIIPSIFHVDIPIQLSDAIQHASSTAEMEQIGAEWLINQSLELKKAGVPVLHYYTLGKPAVIRKVLEAIF